MLPIISTLARVATRQIAKRALSTAVKTGTRQIARQVTAKAIISGTARSGASAFKRVVTDVPFREIVPDGKTLTKLNWVKFMRWAEAAFFAADIAYNSDDIIELWNAVCAENGSEPIAPPQDVTAESVTNEYGSTAENMAYVQNILEVLAKAHDVLATSRIPAIGGSYFPGLSISINSNFYSTLIIDEVVYGSMNTLTHIGSGLEETGQFEGVQQATDKFYESMATNVQFALLNLLEERGILNEYTGGCDILMTKALEGGKQADVLNQANRLFAKLEDRNELPMFTPYSLITAFIRAATMPRASGYIELLVMYTSHILRRYEKLAGPNKFRAYL